MTAAAVVEDPVADVEIADVAGLAEVTVPPEPLGPPDDPPSRTVGGPLDVIARVLARSDKLTAVDLRVALAVILDTALTPTAPLPDLARIRASAHLADERAVTRALDRLDQLAGCTPAVLRLGAAAIDLTVTYPRRRPAPYTRAG